jgi:ElaB/YqjD/DUF883 family membrane-anchored ribosome-binding protein
MMTTIESARKTVAERFNPALDSLEESVRMAGRAIDQGRHAVTDLAAGTELNIRRHPLMSVAVAGLAGAVAGCTCGFLLGWQTRRPS